MKKHYKVFGFIATVALFASCASMSTMQTARTTHKGEFATGFGGGYVKTDVEIGTLDTISIAAPFMEIGGRYGITDKLDVGAKLTLIGTAGVDVKYQFLGDKESMFAAAVGGGLGYLSISSGDSESNLIDLQIPVYLSLHPTEWLSIYASPKYVMRNNFWKSSSTTGNDMSHWYGATGGLRLGRGTAFFAEYSYFGNSAINKPFSQFTVGVGIKIR